ncbi:MAG: AgmX/PglI C-terminal domain-containing protein [Bradymonadaceae bacterium]
MAKQSDQKILRIGLVQNGKIVEERLMRSRSDVNVGQDFKKNDFVVPVSDLPQSFPVFELKGERYVLNFTDQMEGRVSAGGEVNALSDLRARGKAKEGKHGHYVPLPPTARGRVQAGDATLLFQFVTPPPKRPQPVLPASMRGGWVKGLDRILVAVIAISAVLQLGFVIWLESQEWPMPKDVNRTIPDRFVKVKEKEKKDKPEPKKQKKKKSEKTKPSEKKKPKKKAESKEPKEKNKEEMSPEEQAKKEAQKQRQMAKEVKNKTILGEIGHVTKKGGGSVADVLSDGAGKKSMDEAFADSEGVTTGSGAEKSGLQTSGSSDAEGSGEATGIGKLDETSGAKKAEKGVGTGEKKEQKVQAEVDLKSPERTAGRGSLDSGSIRNVIKRYASRIQRCYERQLKKDNSAGGKVIVSFTIGRAGRVTTSSSKTDTVGGGVGQCVADVIKSLRFPRPDGGEVMVNKTFVFEAGG